MFNNYIYLKLTSYGAKYCLTTVVGAERDIFRGIFPNRNTPDTTRLRPTLREHSLVVYITFSLSPCIQLLSLHMFCGLDLPSPLTTLSSQDRCLFQPPATERFSKSSFLCRSC